MISIPTANILVLSLGPRFNDFISLLSCSVGRGKMVEVDTEVESSSVLGKVGEDECSEWTTVVVKTGTKWKWSKIGVEETCINHKESLLVGMLLLSKVR